MILNMHIPKRNIQTVLQGKWSTFFFQRVLNLMGNPVIKKIPNYRKIFIVRLVSPLNIYLA